MSSTRGEYNHMQIRRMSDVWTTVAIAGLASTVFVSVLAYTTLKPGQFWHTQL